jgi:hypothetical protein
MTAGQGHQGDAVPQSPALELPPLPIPLPPGAVAVGPLDKPCRCGSKEFADFPSKRGEFVEAGTVAAFADTGESARRTAHRANDNRRRFGRRGGENHRA